MAGSNRWPRKGEPSASHPFFSISWTFYKQKTDTEVSRTAQSSAHSASSTGGPAWATAGPHAHAPTHRAGGETLASNEAAGLSCLGPLFPVAKPSGAGASTSDSHQGPGHQPQPTRSGYDGPPTHCFSSNSLLPPPFKPSPQSHSLHAGHDSHGPCVSGVGPEPTPHTSPAPSPKGLGRRPRGAPGQALTGSHQ